MTTSNCTINLPGSRRQVTITSDTTFESEYKGKRILIEQWGDVYFARSVNDDGSVYGPTVVANDLDRAISKAEDGIDWVQGERSVLFGSLNIPTVRLADGQYESKVVGLTGGEYPSARANTVQLSKVLAANNFMLREQSIQPFGN